MFWFPLLDPEGYTLYVFSQKTPREVDYRISNKAIHNLSSYKLSLQEKTLLGLGLKFIPPSKFPNEPELLQEYHAFSRQLRLRWFFKDSNNTLPPFRVPNPSWNPESKYQPLEEIIAHGETLLLESIEACHHTRQNRLPHHLSKALRKLKSNPNIIIKPADKNLGLCVLDREWYLNEGQRQLSDATVYKSVENVPFEELYDRLSSVVNKYRMLIGNNGAKYILLKPPNGYRVCSLYFLPKIHKPTVVGRPICSYNGFIFEKTSIWLHHKLFPILTEQSQHLQDSLSLVRDVETLRFPNDIILFTFDVESLYPSIPTKEGLSALREMIKGKFESKELNLIMTLAALVLEHHYLEFDGKYWRQIKGTAMGSNFAVVYACLFLCFLEKVQGNPQQLLYFKRYIDDALGFWEGDEESLKSFLNNYASGLQDHIRITPALSKTGVNFLDIYVYKSNDFYHTRKLSVSCYMKELNRYQYLPFTSWHPKHQKEAFITGELRRYVIRESKYENFLKLRRLFLHRLIARGYPYKFIRACFEKIDYSRRSEFLNKNPQNKGKGHGTVFKLFFSKFAKRLKLKKRVLDEIYNKLQNDAELRHIPRPIVCWKNPRSLRSYLVRSRIRN